MSRSPSSAHLREAIAEKCRRSFHAFARAAWPLVEPTMPLREGWHFQAVCEHLEAVSRGEIRHLLINIPPGHAKSLLVAVLWPAWVWTHNPGWRSIFCSYALDLATRDSKRCRDLERQPWYQDMFVVGRGKRGAPLWTFREDSDRQDLYENTATGSRMCMSVGSKGAGFRGRCVVADDPNNTKDAPSKVARDEVIRWWNQVMPTRVNDPGTDSFVVIQQRVHQEDLSGHLLEGGQYEHLCLPSEFDSKRRAVTYVHRADGTRQEFWRDPRAVEGELLFPELFPQHVLDGLKRPIGGLGEDGFAGQHQQTPAAATGGMFKYAWWRFFRYEGRAAGAAARPTSCDQSPARIAPRKWHQVLVSLDAAFKDGDENDYVVATVWGIHGADRYLLEAQRGKLDYVATKAMLRDLRVRYPEATVWLVEDKANGSAIVSELGREIPGIIAINPEGGKESRAAACTPQVEAGNVYLLEGAEYVADFVDELGVFPRGKHDDQVDSMSQTLNYLTQHDDVSTALAMATM